jgi:hypothetical protein
MRQTLVGRLQRLEQPGARNLVVVDPEDPVAVAQRVQPAERPLDRLGEGIGDKSVGELADRAEPVAIDTVVDRDDELVCNGTQNCEEGRKTSG